MHEDLKNTSFTGLVSQIMIVTIIINLHIL